MLKPKAFFIIHTAQYYGAAVKSLVARNVELPFSMSVRSRCKE